METRGMEDMWRTLTLASFHTAREAAKRMAPRGTGSIMFTGGRASRRGDAGFGAYAVAQFGIRGLAETLSRELAPKGIHVAHLVIEGTIAKEAARTARSQQFQAGGMVDPDSLAEIYWQTHIQPRTCWTFEVDVRPWSEPLFAEWRRPGLRP
jgi:NAD(P)-dependent dehydrogenase (short-subunit alcohol dehydrogenase family)